jgi:hypothetical protein
MDHAAQVVTGYASGATPSGLLERVRFGWLFDRMRMLKHVSSRRFYPHGVRDGELVQDCGDRLEQRWSEKPLILRGQRRDEPNVHTTPHSRSMAVEKRDDMQ